MKISRYKRSSLYPRLHPSYALPDGGPVLRDQSRKWRHLNGFGFQWRDTHIWIEFRRYR